jgi:hypothetical protein
MKSILDPSFRYTAGFGMDLRPATRSRSEAITPTTRLNASAKA